ncbi:MAG: glycosyltransferase [Clostridia bacterium]|jgi:glycosyltransferase involved in cell wall biosynthesis|nr:glycosyltransferase [Clostridia bacterium]
MKIYFFLSTDENSTTSYSNDLLASSLGNQGYKVEIVRDIREKFKILNKPDGEVIIFQKTIQCAAHTSKAIRHLKGKVYLVHIDDDFLDMQNKEHIETLNISDLIIVGTQKHKTALRDYTTTPVEAITGILDLENYEYVPVDKKSNNPLIISWQQSCADAYVKDLLMVAKPLCALNKEYGIQLHLYGWHMGKDYPDHSGKVREAMPFAKFIEYQPMKQYLANIVPQIAKSDIFVMPYIDHPNRWGKSGFGLKRMMLLGLPVVASDTQHHATLIENGVNGFLASTDEQWYLALKSLINDRDLREKLSMNARKLIEKKYNNEITSQEFLQVLKKYIPFF